MYRAAIGWMLRRIALTAQSLSRHSALVIGELLGRAMGSLMKRPRRDATRHLARAFGEAATARGRLGLCDRCFVTFGRSLLETLRLPGMSEEEILDAVDVSGFEEIERVLARGKGALILSGHMGTWEVLAAWLGVRLGRPFHALGRRISTEVYNEILVSTRRAAGVETVYQDESPRHALRLLKDNKPLGILADQDIPRLDGVFVEFFGRPAYTPTAPVALARASGAGIVPVLITWAGRRHHIHVMPEVELVRTGDKRADTVESTQRWSRVVEAVIRAHPEQWAWFHRRWKTRPPS